MIFEALGQKFQPNSVRMRNLTYAENRIYISNLRGRFWGSLELLVEVPGQNLHPWPHRKKSLSHNENRILGQSKYRISVT